jgi:hypothetical protein
MACYDFDYAMQLLRQSIDLAEIEHDFVPLRKWANEVEQSGYEIKTIETRLNHPANQGLLLITLQSVAAGMLLPEEAGQSIYLWLNND